MSSSKKSSPRTSQCSTASEILLSSASSTKTAKLPSVSKASINGSSTTSGTASASATTNTSAFSMIGIGKKLTKYLRKYYKSTALSKRGNASKKMARQKYVFHRRGLLLAASQTPASSSKSASSFGSKKGMQKWVFSCKGCSRPITRDDVKANNAIFAMDEVWHRSHLVCFKCSANIGDEYRPFITSGLKDKHPLCLDCHMEAEHQTCSACNLPLFETCIEFDEKRMHQNCFVCEKCKAPFEGGEYALINGKPYDLDCYFFKAFDTAFAPQLPGSYFDLQVTSPPPIAATSDSSTSLPTLTTTTTTPPIENQTYFKKTTTELVSLCDVGHPSSITSDGAAITTAKESSGEVFETQSVKAPLKPPPGTTASTASTSAETVLSSDSKEKVGTPPARSPVYKEKLEDFVNGHEELLKTEKSDEKLISSGSNEMKKEIDQTKIESKKGEVKKEEEIKGEVRNDEDKKKEEKKAEEKMGEVKKDEKEEVKNEEKKDDVKSELKKDQPIEEEPKKIKEMKEKEEMDKVKNEEEKKDEVKKDEPLKEEPKKEDEKKDTTIL